MAAKYLVVLILLVPCYFLNKLLQKIIQPRRSGGRFFGYLFSVLAFVFIYSFLVVQIVAYLFPSSMK
jgi:hypothetical protein